MIWYVELREKWGKQPNTPHCGNKKWRPITAFEVRRDARDLARCWNETDESDREYRVHRHRNRTKRDYLVHASSHRKPGSDLTI